CLPRALRSLRPELIHLLPRRGGGPSALEYGRRGYQLQGSPLGPVITMFGSSMTRSRLAPAASTSQAVDAALTPRRLSRSGSAAARRTDTPISRRRRVPSTTGRSSCPCRAPAISAHQRPARRAAP